MSPGEYFIPFGKDVCEKCKCVAGKAVGCIFEKCLQKPTCKTYKAAVGTCCQFECIKGLRRLVCYVFFLFASAPYLQKKFSDDDLPEKTEFIVLLSLGTGLLLLLFILFLLLCYRRGRNRAEKQKSKVKSLEQISREQNGENFQFMWLYDK